MSLWLEAAGAPDLAGRVQWWRDREEALRTHGPLLLLSGPTPQTPEAHGRLDTWLPLRTLREDVHGALRTWFGPALEVLGVDLQPGALGQARSWLEVRAWLPSLADVPLPAEWLERLADARTAHDLLFELFAPPRWGAALGRYPDRLERLTAELRGRAGLRVWDAGCATGEGTWELAAALAGNQPLEVLGTTPWPLERLMAERRARPHDPERTASLRAFLDAADLGGVEVRFEAGDLRRDRPKGSFELVVCHGVIEGALAGDDAERALEQLAVALAPGGLLSITDRFREDRTKAAATRVSALAQRHGLLEVEPGLLRR